MLEPADIVIESLLWDERSEAKIEAHELRREQIEEVVANAPQIFKNLPDRSAEYLMIGPDFVGRFYYVPIVSTRRRGEWYVVTAYRISRRRALRYYRPEGET
jgi:hypothetical protein